MYQDTRFAADDGYEPSALIGPDGKAYAKYGLGLPLVEMPFLALVHVIRRVTDWPLMRIVPAVLSLLNPLLAALMVTVVFALCRRFAEARAGLVAAVAYPFGTLALVHATRDGSDTLEALTLVTAVLLLVRYGSAPERRLVLGAALALALTMTTKLANVIAVPGCAAYLVVVARRRSRRTVDMWIDAAVFAAPILACLTGLVWLNWAPLAR